MIPSASFDFHESLLDQNSENNSATGKLIGQVAPTRTEQSSLIRLESLASSQVIPAQINDITA